MCFLSSRIGGEDVLKETGCRCMACFLLPVEWCFTFATGLTSVGAWCRRRREKREAPQQRAELMASEVFQSMEPGAFLGGCIGIALLFCISCAPSLYYVPAGSSPVNFLLLMYSSPLH